MSIPEGFFTAITQSYYGLNPQEQEAEELWGEFVASLPAGTVIDPESPDIQEQYLAFLAGKLSSTYRSEASSALSPAEIEARKIVWTVFDILLVLLQEVTALQILNSETLSFLTKYQKEYSDLMARAFFYVGSGSVDREVWKNIYGVPEHEGGGRILESSLDARMTPTVPSDIASEFKLGYADITLQEVFEYLYDQYKDIGEGETVRFMLESSAWRDKDPNRTDGPNDQTRRNECEILLTKNSDNEITISVRMNQRIASLAERTNSSRALAYDTLVERMQNKLDILIDQYPVGSEVYEIDFPDSEEYLTQIVPGLGDYQWLIDDVNAAKNASHLAAAYYDFKRLANQYLDMLEQVEVWSSTPLSVTLTDATEEEIYEQMNTAFQTVYSEAKTADIVEISASDLSPWEQNQSDKLQEAFISFRDLKIPWDWGILAGGIVQDATGAQTAKLSEQKELRGAINQKINTFIETIDSKMKLIEDRADQQREVIEAASSARKMTNEIIQTAIRQLQNILASIYK